MAARTPRYIHPFHYFFSLDRTIHRARTFAWRIWDIRDFPFKIFAGSTWQECPIRIIDDFLEQGYVYFIVPY